MEEQELMCVKVLMIPTHIKDFIQQISQQNCVENVFTENMLFHEAPHINSCTRKLFKPFEWRQD